MNPLFINFLLYLIYFFFIYKKNGLTVYSLLFLYEVAISFLGYYTFETGIYQKHFGNCNESKLSLIPYLCNFIAVLIVAYPLKKIRIEQVLVDSNRKQENTYKLLTYVVCAITVVYSVVLYFMARRLEGISFGDIYEANHSGEAITFGIPFLDFILTKIYQIINVFIPFVLSFHFVKLAKKENIKKSVVVILVIFIPQLLTCIVMAARGRMFFLFAHIIFYIVLFYPKFEAKTKRMIKVLGLWTVLLACVYGILISASRSNSGVSTMDGIARYFGEPYPNLSVSYWNAPDINHPYGARHFYGIYKFFDNSLDLGAGLGERHNYWTSYTNVPIYNFKTLYGDLYIEYGVLFPFVFLGISTGLYLYLRKKIKGYSNIVIMYLCYHIGVYGLFDYLADIGFRELILSLTIILFVNLFGRNRKRIYEKNYK